MQKAGISVYAKHTNALWQGKWKRILIPCQVQLPATPLCCLLRPSVPLWHSSKMLAGCLLNTEKTVLEVAPLKVCQTSVCVSTEPAVPVAMILFEFGLLDFGSIRGCFFHVPCSLMECQDSQTCSLCPGLSRPQPKSLSVPLDRIKLWSLHNQMLIIKRCLFHTRASQALLCCPTVAQKLYKVNTENYYHMTRFLWSVSSCFSVKSYTISKDHFSETNIHPFKCCLFC